MSVPISAGVPQELNIIIPTSLMRHICLNDLLPKLRLECVALRLPIHLLSIAMY